MNKLFLGTMAVVVCSSAIFCNRTPAHQGPGFDEVMVDYTLGPLIDSEQIAYEGLKATNKIYDTPGAEPDLFDALMKDSIRFIISARALNEQEKQYFRSQNLVTNEAKIAIDGIAVLVNKEFKAENIGWQKLLDICSGKVMQWKDLYPDTDWGDLKVVFDHPRSSIIRHISDSLMGGVTELPSTFSALQSCEEVIDYVEKNKNAIGFIGVGWISEHDDSTVGGFLNRIKVLAVENPKTQQFHKPLQAYLATQDYPLTRNIYAISRSSMAFFPFSSFLTNEKGQRVVLKMGLVPATMPVRLIKVKTGEENSGN